MKAFCNPQLILVMVLLGLVSWLDCSWGHRLERDNLSQCESNERNLGTALEMYSTDNSGRYPTVLSAIAPRHLRVLPTCPAAGADTYSSTYQSASNPDAYTFCCRGHHHASLPADFPQFFSNQSLSTGH